MAAAATQQQSGTVAAVSHRAMQLVCTPALTQRVCTTQLCSAMLEHFEASNGISGTEHIPSS
eukprot:9607-Heterococcus_DN1.PRE.3